MTTFKLQYPWILQRLILQFFDRIIFRWSYRISGYIVKKALFPVTGWTWKLYLGARLFLSSLEYENGWMLKFLIAGLIVTVQTAELFSADPQVHLLCVTIKWFDRFDTHNCDYRFELDFRLEQYRITRGAHI